LLKSRIEGCEQEQTRIKIKQASLVLTYNNMERRMTDLETFVKKGLPNFDDLQMVTDRVNEIADQTTG
jgi:hypothetical protein